MRDKGVRTYLHFLRTTFYDIPRDGNSSKSPKFIEPNSSLIFESPILEKSWNLLEELFNEYATPFDGETGDASSMSNGFVLTFEWLELRVTIPREFLSPLDLIEFADGNSDTDADWRFFGAGGIGGGIGLFVDGRWGGEREWENESGDEECDECPEFTLTKWGAPSEEDGDEREAASSSWFFFQIKNYYTYRQKHTCEVTLNTGEDCEEDRNGSETPIVEMSCGISACGPKRCCRIRVHSPPEFSSIV